MENNPKENKKLFLKFLFNWNPQALERTAEINMKVSNFIRM